MYEEITKVKRLAEVEAQESAVQMLCRLSPEKTLEIGESIVDKIKNIKCNGDFFVRVEAQLYHCINLSSELRRDPNKYKDFLSVVKAIVARQNTENIDGDGTITVGMCQKLLNLNSRQWYKLMRDNQLNRRTLLETLCVDIKTEILGSDLETLFNKLKKLCAGFKTESLRYFWENQLFQIYPNVSLPDETEPIAMTCYQLICESLIKEQKASVEQVQTFSKQQTQIEKELSKKGLYDQIYFFAKTHGCKIEGIWDIVDVSKNTWYDWKDKWEIAEGKNTDAAPEKKAQMRAPDCRLSHLQVLILIMYLKLDESEARILMNSAGYRFVEKDESDKEVLSYLRGESQKTREEIMSDLIAEMRNNWLK